MQAEALVLQPAYGYIMEEPQSITTRLHGVTSQDSVFFMKVVVVQFSEFPSYFGPLGPGVIFSCQCRLWSCSNDTVVQFLAGAEIFCFLSVFTLALGSTQLHIQR